MRLPTLTGLLNSGARDVLLVGGLFVVTRLCYLAMGVNFDASPASWFLQFIPLEWLREDFTGTIYYSHAAPPVLNIVTAFGDRVFGSHAVVFYLLLWHVMGFALLYAVYAVTRRLTGLSAPAWGVTVILAISPSFQLYGNWLMYTFPATFLITFSALLLLRFLDAPTLLRGFAFFTCLGVLVLTRSMFHIAWLALVAIILVVILSRSRREVLAAAAIPLLVCVLWYGKNYYLFGGFSASSLLGLSLSNVTLLTVDRSVLAEHVKSGELSYFAVVSRYEDLDDVILDNELAPETGVRILDEALTPAGRLNYNSLEMLVAARHYQEDSLKTMQLYPGNYLAALQLSHRIFFTPASKNVYFQGESLRAVATIATWFDRIAYGAFSPYYIRQLHFGVSNEHMVPANPGLFLAAFSLLIFIYGAGRCMMILLKGDWRPETITFGFLWGAWLMIYLIGTFAELWENNRYRFISEPAYWILLAVMLNDLYSALLRLNRRRVIRNPSGPTPCSR